MNPSLRPAHFSRPMRHAMSKPPAACDLAIAIRIETAESLAREISYLRYQVVTAAYTRRSGARSADARLRCDHQFRIPRPWRDRNREQSDLRRRQRKTEATNATRLRCAYARDPGRGGL